MTTQSILDDAERINQPINEVFLGRSLKNIWGEKIQKSSAVSGKGSGYKNLKKRIVDETCNRRIEHFSEEIVDKIQQLCSTGIGWIVSHSILEQRVTLLKVPSSESSATAGTTMEGRRLVCEVTVTLDPSKIVVRTHGEAVLLKDIIDEEFEELSLSAIDTVVRLVEATSLCTGHLAITNEGDRDSHLLQVPVSGSKVLNTTTKDLRQEMLVSTSCLLFAFGKKACANCVYVAKLWRNRESKRKMKEQSIPHGKCNLRFLAREGLKGKINAQRREIRSDMTRERRMKDEMIIFSESDNVDLRKVFDGVESKDVPPEMKLLWDVQMKQLSVKSPKGYRWHPRFFIKLLCLFVYD